MTSQKGTTPKPPKEIWVNVYDHERAVVHRSLPSATDCLADGITAHYRLVTPKPEPREAVAYVVKRDDKYLYSYSESAWKESLSLAERWASAGAARDAAEDLGDGTRIVKLVRKRGTP